MSTYFALKSKALWDMTLYCWASSSQHFKRSWCLHHELHVYKYEGIMILQFTSQYTSVLSKTTMRDSDLLFYFDGA